MLIQRSDSSFERMLFIVQQLCRSLSNYNQEEQCLSYAQRQLEAEVIEWKEL
jgi:hypothetical protein